MADVFSNSLNSLINQVFGLIENHVVGWGVFEFLAAEAAFEFGDTVEAMLRVV